MISKLAAWINGLWAEAQPSAADLDRSDLIVLLEVYVEARCPCGSQHIHRLSLSATSECARCGRTLGVRSLEYYRPHVNALPDPIVSVGYVLTRDSLARRPTSGVLH